MYLRIIILLLILLLGTLTFNLYRTPVSAQTFNCPNATPRANGLVTAHTALDGLSNPWNQCATGSQIVFAPFDITNFQGLYERFYFHSSPTANKHEPPYTGAPFTEADINSEISGGGSQDTLFYFNGDLVISNPIVGDRTGVVFVNGRIDIRTNICYGSPGTTAGTGCTPDPNRNSVGLVFVASGPINIYGTPTVREINAILISSQDHPSYTSTNYTICTYFETSIPNCPIQKTSILLNTDRLVVYGSLISFNPDKQIYFRRDLENNTNTPAEQVIAQAKYFAILKDLFSIPHSVTTENTHAAEQFP